MPDAQIEMCSFSFLCLSLFVASRCRGRICVFVCQYPLTYSFVIICNSKSERDRSKPTDDNCENHRNHAIFHYLFCAKEQKRDRAESGGVGKRTANVVLFCHSDRVKIKCFPVLMRIICVPGRWQYFMFSHLLNVKRSYLYSFVLGFFSSFGCCRSNALRVIRSLMWNSL